MDDNVHRYIVGIETNPDEARNALMNIIQNIDSKSGSLLKLVGSLQQFLISDEPSIRAKGLSLLTGVLKEVSAQSISQKDVTVLSQFYTERLHDKYCLTELLQGIEALQNLYPLCSAVESISMIQGLFQSVRVQELSQSLRLLCFNIILSTLNKFPEEITKLGSPFVKNLIDSVDGEKDPRNLIIVFKLVKEMVLLCDISSYVEDIFDVTFCYFPITFKSPKDDPFSVSPLALKDGLKDVLSSTPLLGTLVIPSLLKTLGSSSIKAKKDSLNVLCSAIPVYNSESFTIHLNEILSCLTEEVYHPLDDSVQELSFEAAEKLFSKLFTKELLPQDLESVKAELTKTSQNAISRILEQENKDLKSASRFLCALSRSNKKACFIVMSICIDPLMKAYQEAELVTHRKSLLETLCNFLNVYMHLYSAEFSSVTALNHADPILSISGALVNYFHEVIGIVSEYSELRKVAIKGLATSIILPQLVPLDEKEYYVQKITNFFLEEDSNVREISLGCLSDLSQFFPELIKNNCLPLFLKKIKQIELGDQKSITLVNQRSILLEALVKLANNTHLFFFLLAELVDLTEHSLKISLEYTCSLLVSIRTILENQRDLKHSELFDTLISLLIKKLWGFSINTTLSQKDHAALGCEIEILDVITHISILVIRELSAAIQEKFLIDCYDLFYGTGRKATFFEDNIDFDLSAFFPFNIQTSEAQPKLSILLAAAISASRKEALVSFISQERNLSQLVELVFATNHAVLQKSCAIIIASILNKNPTETSLDFASKICDQDLKFVAFDFSASSAQRRKALDLMIWVMKALIAQGNQIGYSLLDSVFLLLQDNVLGEQAAQGLSNLLTNDDWYFSKLSFFNIRILYKQRVFSTIFPALKDAFNNDYAKTIHHHYLLALAALLSKVNSRVLVREGDSLLPLLKSSLMDPSTKIQESAIKALNTLMIEGAIPASKLGLQSINEDSLSLLELLLSLATDESSSDSMSSSTRKYSIPIRIGALKCLTLVPKLLSSSLTKENIDFDSALTCRLVSKRLGLSLDDPKRLVRNEAVKCHHQWLTTNFSTNK